MTLEQFLRILRAGHRRATMFSDPNSRRAIGDALEGMIQEIQRIQREEAK